MRQKNGASDDPAGVLRTRGLNKTSGGTDSWQHYRPCSRHPAAASTSALRLPTVPYSIACRPHGRGSRLKGKSSLQAAIDGERNGSHAHVYVHRLKGKPLCPAWNNVVTFGGGPMYNKEQSRRVSGAFFTRLREVADDVARSDKERHSSHEPKLRVRATTATTTRTKTATATTTARRRRRVKSLGARNKTSTNKPVWAATHGGQATA